MYRILSNVYIFQKIKEIQKSGPYNLVGYSFGASVAFETGVVLEAAGEKVSLVLLDGSPSYVLTHQNSFKNRHSDNKVDDRDAFTYFVLLFKELDYQTVRPSCIYLLFYFTNLRFSI